jgi:hypothetical protein
MPGTNAQRFHIYTAVDGAMIANVRTPGHQQELMKTQATMAD